MRGEVWGVGSRVCIWVEIVDGGLYDVGFHWCGFWDGFGLSFLPSYDIVETGYPVRERVLLYTCILACSSRCGICHWTLERTATHSKSAFARVEGIETANSDVTYMGLLSSQWHGMHCYPLSHASFFDGLGHAAAACLFGNQ